MAVTVITEGPIDKLNKGILAGQKLVATFAQLRAIKSANDLREKQFQLTKENARFTQEALTSRTAANDAATALGRAQLDAFAEEHKADLIASKSKVRDERLQAQQRLANALVDVSDEDLTLSESIQMGELIGLQTQTLPTPANALALTMLAKGAHSQAMAKIDIEKRRADAFALTASSSAIRSASPGVTEFYRSLGNQFDRLSKSIERNKMIIDVPGMSPDMIKSAETALKRDKKERDDVEFDLLRAEGRINQTQQQTSQQPPTLNTIEQVRDFQGSEFIWGPTGDRRIKNK